MQNGVRTGRDRAPRGTTHHAKRVTAAVILTVGAVALHRATRQAAPVVNAAGKAVAFAAVLASMFAFLAGCGARSARDFSSDGGDSSAPARARHDAGSVSTVSDSGAPDATLDTSPDTSTDIDAASEPPEVPIPAPVAVEDAGLESATERDTSETSSAPSVEPSSVITTDSVITTPSSCDPTQAECGAEYCTPAAAQCVIREDDRPEGVACDAHAQCADGHGCGFIADPQLRQLACLRLGRSDQDCGGALGRIKFGVGITALVDESGSELGLCIGDIR